MVEIKRVFKTANNWYYKILFNFICFLTIWFGCILMELNSIKNYIGCCVVLTIAWILWVKNPFTNN